MMGRPHQPMTLAEHHARVPAALARAWDQRAIAAMALAGIEPDRPGLHEEHIFDFEGGVRLIVSRELTYLNGAEVVHVSVSGTNTLDAEAYIEGLGLGRFSWLGATGGPDCPVHHYYQGRGIE